MPEWTGATGPGPEPRSPAAQLADCSGGQAAGGAASFTEPSRLQRPATHDAPGMFAPVAGKTGARCRSCFISAIGKPFPPSTSVPQPPWGWRPPLDSPAGCPGAGVFPVLTSVQEGDEPGSRGSPGGLPHGVQRPGMKPWASSVCCCALGTLPSPSRWEPACQSSTLPHCQPAFGETLHLLGRKSDPEPPPAIPLNLTKR